MHGDNSTTPPGLYKTDLLKKTENGLLDEFTLRELAFEPPAVSAGGYDNQRSRYVSGRERLIETDTILYLHRLVVLATYNKAGWGVGSDLPVGGPALALLVRRLLAKQFFAGASMREGAIHGDNRIDQYAVVGAYFGTAVFGEQ